MFRKSKNWVNYREDSSSSSSENSMEDTNYTLRWSTRLVERKNYISFSESQRINTKEGITETKSSMEALKQEHGRTRKRRDWWQEEMQKNETPSSSRRMRNEGNGDKLGQRKATILGWLIDSQTVKENWNIWYMDKAGEKAIKEGKINKAMILCNCCNDHYTIVGFQAHAGREIDKPYDHIFLGEKCVSLLSCMAEAWDKPEEYTRRRFNAIENEHNVGDPYDDACIICADGGNLMCCENCTSTYHHSCMGLEAIPQDSWYCPYCVCKFCGDPAQEENDNLFDCSQCKKKYHWRCYQQIEPNDISIDVDTKSTPCTIFCEEGCREVYEKLHKMVGQRNYLDDGCSWTLLRTMDQDSNIYVPNLYQRIECNSKLALSWRTMKECFEPIVDRHTAIDMIQSVVYSCGSNFNRINFRSFYTAVLERGDEILSVASVRIHGTKIAEMPFIATNVVERKKGLCRKLVTAIESALCYLNVEYLIIPSVFEKIGSWIENYGFCVMEPKLKEEVKCYNTLMFHDSVRLQKSLLPPDFTKQTSSQDKVVLKFKTPDLNRLGPPE